MDELEKQIKIYKKYIGDPKRKNNQLLFYCPFCKYDKRKFSLNIEEQIFHCWVCDKSGTVFSYLKLKNATKEELKYFFKRHQLHKNKYESKDIHNLCINLPVDYRNLPNINDTNTERVYNYALKRGLNDYKMQYYNLGCSDLFQFRDYLLIPSYNSDGNVNYLQGRYILDDDNKKKHINVSEKECGYTKNDIIPFELFVDWDEPIIFVEGFFDININYNCLPLLGSSLNEKSPILLKIIKSNCKRVYIMLDDDAVNKAFKMGKILLSYGIDSIFCNVYPYHEPSQLNDKEFGGLLKNGMKLNYQNVSEWLIKTGK